MGYSPEEARAELARRAAAQGAAGGGAPARRPAKLSVQELKELQNARAAAQSLGGAARDGERFLDLNRETGTGELWGFPWASEARGMFDPKFATMQALTNRMAPAQRIPGSGSSSDTDVRMYKRSVPNPDFTGPTNTAIVKRMQEEAKRAADYAAFLDRYVQQTGSLIGAQEAWGSRQPTQAPAPTPRAAAASTLKARSAAKPVVVDINGNIVK